MMRANRQGASDGCPSQRPCCARRSAIRQRRGSCRNSRCLLTLHCLVPARCEARHVHGICWRGVGARAGAIRRCRRDRHSGAPGSASLGPLPHARRRCAGRHLDSRRPGGDARGCCGGRTQAKSGAAIQQHRHRSRRQRLPGRCRARRDLLRLADGPAGAQETVLHHAGGLPDGHRGHGLDVELVDLRALPLCNRRRHRRRICGHQLHHPGADPRARARLDRSRHQRQLLGRRGHRCGRVDRPARSDAVAGRHRAGARPSRSAASLSLVILLMRMWLPESPRWLLTHGRAQEAEAIVAGIEQAFRRQGHAARSRAVSQDPAARAHPYTAE